MRFFIVFILIITPFYSAQAMPLPEFHQCNKTLTYQLYFSGLKVGTLSRHVHWRGNQAKVYAYGNADVLVTSSKYKNQSEMTWSEAHQSFITKSFEQNISGLLSRKATGIFSANGQQSTITKNGETTEYDDPEFPLLDGDTLGVQLRLLLIQGKTKFDFKMQSTSKVSHYFFEVLGTEKLATRYGEVETIKVRQAEVDDRQIDMWFAPSLDYQLVKAKYKRNILNLEAEILSMKKECPPTLSAKN
ncbi:DUF3108 domain-containing protein [Photobacterium swingsii]|uniref:DUF3108 domain-containing protein n=1 Tax=Photobacterium swingsii TaxID=680026 RepID=UPI003D1267EB